MDLQHARNMFHSLDLYIYICVYIYVHNDPDSKDLVKRVPS